MRRTLIITFSILAFSSSFAQITLTGSDFSNGGDTFRVSKAFAFFGMDLNAGPNYNWDYSSLSDTYNGQEIDSFIHPSHWPLSLAFAFGFSCNQATYSRTPLLDTVGLPIQGVYNMLNKNSGYFIQRGLGLETGSGAIPVPLNPPDIIYTFPVQYGNIDSSNSGFVINQLPGIYYSTSKKRVNTVDGWGTLTTPFGTFSVLRMQSVIQQHDSIVVDTLGLNFGMDVPEVIEYKWLSQAQGIPILKVTASGGIPTEIVYRDSARMLIHVPEISSSSFSFEVFPNPTSSQISVTYVLKETSDLVFEIVDLTGRIIFSETYLKQSAGEHEQILPLKQILVPGNYFLHMRSKQQSLSKPLVVIR
jgi:hypothetical protein